MTEGAEHGTAARIVCVCAALWLLHSDGLDKWWEAGPALGGGGRAVPPPRAPKTLGPPKSKYIYMSIYIQLGQVQARNKSPEQRAAKQR